MDKITDNHAHSNWQERVCPYTISCLKKGGKHRINLVWGYIRNLPPFFRQLRVSGYTLSCLYYVQAAKSGGTLFPAYYIQAAKSVGVHSFLPILKLKQAAKSVSAQGVSTVNSVTPPNKIDRAIYLCMGDIISMHS